MTIINRTRSDVKITLFSRYGEFDLSPYVINCKTSKDMSSPEGRWSVTLVPMALSESQMSLLDTISGKSQYRNRASSEAFLTDLFKLTSADDVVGIWFRNNEDIESGTKWVPVMIGFLSTVERVQTINENGALVTRFSLHGEDFGKLLTKTDCWLDPLDGKLDLGFQPTFKDITGLQSPQDSIAKLLPRVIAGFMLNIGQWIKAPESFVSFATKNGTNAKPSITGAPTVFDMLSQFGVKLSEQAGGYVTSMVNGANEAAGIPNALKYTNVNASPYTDYILCRVDDNVEGAYIDKMLGSINSNLWSLAKDISTPIIHELFIDWIYYNKNFKQAYPTIVCRKYPFAFSDFDNLEYVDVPQNKILESKITRSDRELFNYFNAYYTGFSVTGQNLAKMTGVYRSDASMAVHGRRKMIKTNGSVDFAPLQGMGNSDVMTWMYKMAKQLSEWYRWNHQLFTGNIRMIGDPKIKIGKRLDVYKKSVTVTGSDQNNTIDPKDKIEQYYVERVEHSFEVMAGGKRNFITSVDVTRGIVQGASKISYEEPEDLSTWKYPFGISKPTATDELTNSPTTAIKTVAYGINNGIGFGVNVGG